MGKKSSKTSTGPSKEALPYINSATGAVTDAYNQNQPNIANITSTLQQNMPGVLASTLNNPALGAASTYDQNTLTSNPDPTQNPLFMKMLGNLNDTTADSVNGAIGTRGLTGGSAQSQILASEIGKADNSALLSQYNTNVGAQQAAASNATSVAGAQNGGINSLLQYLTTQAGIPQSSADDYANNIANLWGKSTTTTSTPSFMSSLTGLLGAGASAYKDIAGG